LAFKCPVRFELYARVREVSTNGGSNIHPGSATPWFTVVAAPKLNAVNKQGELGAYLQARRAAVTPADVGMPGSTGHRRVAGLRREEIATLAGVSVDYYARLEQGRERHPSAAVLNALARALRLDNGGREHLFRLADVAFHPNPVSRRARPSPKLQIMLDAWTDTPAMIINDRLDVLASNALADELYSPFESFDNVALMVFLDPAAPTFFARWHHSAETCAANLRTVIGRDGSDGELRDLLEKLLTSTEFRRYWKRHEVRGKMSEAKHFVHPDAGDFTVDVQVFDIREAPGQQLIVYTAEPGTAAVDAFRLLGALAATRSRAAESEPRSH